MSKCLASDSIEIERKKLLRFSHYLHFIRPMWYSRWWRVYHATKFREGKEVKMIQKRRERKMRLLKAKKGTEIDLALSAHIAVIKFQCKEKQFFFVVVRIVSHIWYFQVSNKGRTVSNEDDIHQSLALKCFALFQCACAFARSALYFLHKYFSVSSACTTWFQNESKTFILWTLKCWWCVVNHQQITDRNLHLLNHKQLHTSSYSMTLTLKCNGSIFIISLTLPASGLPTLILHSFVSRYLQYSLCSNSRQAVKFQISAYSRCILQSIYVCVCVGDERAECWHSQHNPE